MVHIFSFASVRCDAQFVAKQLTRDQVQSRKDAAVRFLENVKNDEARADEVEDEDLESYAERRGFTIVDNPRGVKTMAKKDDQLMNPDNMSKTELLDYVFNLEQENEDLQDQLDAVADIVAGPPDDDDDEDDEDNDDVSD